MKQNCLGVHSTAHCNCSQFQNLSNTVVTHSTTEWCEISQGTLCMRILQTHIIASLKNIANSESPTKINALGRQAEQELVTKKKSKIYSSFNGYFTTNRGL